MTPMAGKEACWWKLTVLPVVVFVAAACGSEGSTGLAISGEMIRGAATGATEQVLDSDEKGRRSLFRGYRTSGTISLETDEGERSGEIVYAENADVTYGVDGLEIVHVWGTASASFDDGALPCEGPYASTAFMGEGGAQGSLTLQCEDGSIITAAILSEDVELPPGGENPVQVARELSGWLVPAP